MKDIALELGVSVALVSYVLNGKNTDRINPNTASRIKKLALEREYSPNQIAKSLKTNRTFTLGLIVADISNLFYSSIAKYIEEEANRLGYNVIFGSAYEKPGNFNSILNILMSRQVDGYILAIPEGAQKCIGQLRKLERPFVVIDRKFSEYPDAPSIILDNFDASRRVVQHLHENGFSRPGLVTIKKKLIHLEERKCGFIETTRSLFRTDPFVYELHEEELECGIRTILLDALYKDKVDALCFFTNKISMAALSVMSEIDLHVPGEVGIVCFDEAEAYRIFRTPVTYVRQPLRDMSVAAIDYLVKSIKNGKVDAKATMREFKASLIVKQSSTR